MASYPQGYDEERFETTINRNFLCLICFNVLRNPVLCPRNQHHFCRACITKFLENSQRCPTCADELTVETLTEPPRMVKEYLNESNIHCKYVNRGCHEIVQLQHLDRHEVTCAFTPVVCTNQGCGVTVNKRDQIHHESELCEFRKLKCHLCREITKTLADMEKRIAKIESTIETKMTTAEKNMAKNMDRNVVTVENKLTNIETNFEKTMERNKADMERKIETVNSEVKGLKTALIEGFNEMKEVLVKIEDMNEEKTRKVRPGASGDKEKESIIVAGGWETNSVEIFNWRQRTWSPLQSLPKKRWGATSFVYNNHMTIAGGFCPGSGPVDNMIRINIDRNPDLSKHWSECHVKLPDKLAYHSSVLYKDQLIVTGGYNNDATSNCIDEVELVPHYTVKTLSRMPEPKQCHSTVVFDDNLLIAGGRTTHKCQDTISSVILYDIKKNECKQLAPLPYEACEMATVRWGDNIVVIGGTDKRGNALDTVLTYNVKTEQLHTLPSMRCKRRGCTAVVIGNNIVVLGGKDEGRMLKSVEAFNFDRNTWEELPEMSKERHRHTAVVV